MKEILKNLKFYTAILVVTYLLVVGINYYFDRNLVVEDYIKMLLSVFMITTSIYVSISVVTYVLISKINFKNELVKYVFFYVIQIGTALLVSIFIDIFQKIVINDVFFVDALHQIFTIKMLPQYTLIVFISSIAYFFITYKTKQENKVREHKIVAQSASVKYETLKSQIDPHFLFNSLNVLTSLIEENPAKAQEFTIALSKIYRYVLEQRNKDLVSLNEELDFAKTFIKLLKLRFEDALEINLPNPNMDPDSKVIPLVLQLLLENAVKHNVVKSGQKLIINIEVQNDELIVSNTYQPKSILKEESTGFGLQHILQQYNLVTNRKVLIKQTDAIFKVYLPILTQQIITEVNMDLEYQTDEIIYKKAKARLKELKNFYTNIVALFFLIILYVALIIIGIKHPMFYWMPMSIVIWIFILVMQSIKIFGFKNWEQNMITKFMNQNKNK